MISAAVRQRPATDDSPVRLTLVSRRALALTRTHAGCMTFVMDLITLSIYTTGKCTCILLYKVT